MGRPNRSLLIKQAEMPWLHRCHLALTEFDDTEHLHPIHCGRTKVETLCQAMSLGKNQSLRTICGAKFFAYRPDMHFHRGFRQAQHCHYILVRKAFGEFFQNIEFSTRKRTPVHSLIPGQSRLTYGVAKPLRMLRK
jgi:hypothetical protein